jgi:chromosome segregation ATPase
MTLTELPNGGLRYSPDAEDRVYTPPETPEPFEPPRVTARAVTVDGSVIEQAHAAMVHAHNEFQKHIAKTEESRHLYTADGHRDQIAQFDNTQAAKAVDAAVTQVQERADKAAAQVDKVRRQLSPNGDTAAELRATRYWNRTKAILGNAKEGAGIAAQKLIANADREQLGTLLQELPDYLQTHGQTSDWIDAVVAQAVPEYGAARTQLTKAQNALLVTRSNAESLRKTFRQEGHAQCSSTTTRSTTPTSDPDVPEVRAHDG